MRIRQYRFTQLSASLIIALFLGSGIANAQPMQSQEPAPAGTSMMLLQVIRGEDGNQYVVTRSGIALPIPAPGVAPNATEMQVFRDQDGNFWYNNAYGQGVHVTAQQIQWKLGQIYGRGPIPGGANYQEHYLQEPYAGQQMPAQAQGQAPVQQTTIYQQPAQQSNNGSNGSAALMSGLAAGTGAMVGGIIGGSIANDSGYSGGMPYGVPMYRGAGGQAYYNGADGHPVNVTQNNYNQKAFDNWNKQGDWNQAKNNYDKNHSNQPLSSSQQQAMKQDAQNYKQNDQNKNNGKGFGRGNRQAESSPREMDGSGAKQFQNRGDRGDRGGGRRFGGGRGRRR